MIVYMHSRRDLLRNAYKSRRELCGSRNFFAPRDLTNCASYDTLAKLTRPGGVSQDQEGFHKTRRGFTRLGEVYKSYSQQ